MKTIAYRPQVVSHGCSGSYPHAYWFPWIGKLSSSCLRKGFGGILEHFILIKRRETVSYHHNFKSDKFIQKELRRITLQEEGVFRI